jgi:F-type H+-transporting ATPase subunit alpha
VVELLKQPQYAPLKTWEMALALFAINNGYLDDVEVSNVLPFEVSLRQYMQTSHKDLIDRIEQTYELSKDDEPKLHEAVKSFKKTGAY